MSGLKNLFKKKRKPIVIGVHGLGNKPPRGLLKVWWKHSLIEGLRKIDGAQRRFSFRMAYWADLMYEKPLDPRIKDPDHALHIEEPYIPEPIPSPKIRHTPWHYLKLGFDRIKETMFLSRNGLANYEVLFDMVVKTSFKDLAAYYENGKTDEQKLEIKPVRSKIRQRLLALIRKYRDHEIMIVAHSMGSLITYDVMTSLPAHYKVKVFISMGSPIGLPVLREKITRDHGWPNGEDAVLPTPECVEEWYNFSDEGDHFAVFHDLAKYYEPNKDGIKPIDYLVDNDYKDWVTNNAHKSFGYLREPTLAKVVAEFLGIKKRRFWQRKRKDMY